MRRSAIIPRVAPTSCALPLRVFKPAGTMSPTLIASQEESRGQRLMLLLSLALPHHLASPRAVDASQRLRIFLYTHRFRVGGRRILFASSRTSFSPKGGRAIGCRGRSSSLRSRKTRAWAIGLLAVLRRRLWVATAIGCLLMFGAEWARRDPENGNMHRNSSRRHRHEDKLHALAALDTGATAALGKLRPGHDIPRRPLRCAQSSRIDGTGYV